MKGHDFIPQADDAFLDWSRNFVNGVANPARRQNGRLRQGGCHRKNAAKETLMRKERIAAKQNEKGDKERWSEILSIITTHDGRARGFPPAVTQDACLCGTPAGAVEPRSGSYTRGTQSRTGSWSNAPALGCAERIASLRRFTRNCNVRGPLNSFS
jgi:hypothetical protein